MGSQNLKQAVVDCVCRLGSSTNVFNYREKLFERSGFALTYLYSQYGLLDKPFKKTYRINDKGKQIINNFPNYDELFKEIINLPKISKKAINSKQKSDFHDDISSKLDMHNDNLRQLLLNKILKKEPVFFEQLVVQLLSRMGYKGKNGDAIVTQLSGDNGIDGIINQDPLGTSTVYIQAKRNSKDNKVGSPKIHEFRGALEAKQASKGVFITTSNFSKDALREAERLSIVTINGDELTSLMLDYQVGVQVKDTFKLLSIDNDFFE